MIDLDHAYRRLARPWAQPQLAAHYRDAEQRGAQLIEGARDDLARPLPLVASAIPPSATLSVAIHMLHALPESVRGDLPRQLLDSAEKNVADALYRCHRALELDGTDHGYTADEWLPIVCDVAAPLLESARLTEDPPTLVGQTQEAIGWLSRAVVELYEGSADAPNTLSEALGRLLTIWMFSAETHDDRALGNP